MLAEFSDFCRDINKHSELSLGNFSFPDQWDDFVAAVAEKNIELPADAINGGTVQIYCDQVGALDAQKSALLDLKDSLEFEYWFLLAAQVSWALAAVWELTLMGIYYCS